MQVKKDKYNSRRITTKHLTLLHTSFGKYLLTVNENNEKYSFKSRRLAFEVFRRASWLMSIFKDIHKEMDRIIAKAMEDIENKNIRPLIVHSQDSKTQAMHDAMGFKGKRDRFNIDGTTEELYFYKNHKPTDFQGFAKIRDTVWNSETHKPRH